MTLEPSSSSSAVSNSILEVDHHDVVDVDTDDETLLKLALDAYHVEKLFVACEYLKRIKNQTEFITNNDTYQNILQLGSICHDAVQDLLFHVDDHNNSSSDNNNNNDSNDNNNETKSDSDNDVDEDTTNGNPIPTTTTTTTTDGDGGWTKQGETHGKYRTNVYYKYPKLDTPSASSSGVGGGGGYFRRAFTAAVTTSALSSSSPAIICRLETAVPASLLIPLLSVLNETDLYETWVPFFPALNMGLTKSKRLKQFGLVNQKLFLYGPCPWPFDPRQLIIESTCIDECDATSLNYFIGIHLRNVHDTLQSTDPMAYNELPPEHEQTVSADFNGTFLFRPCPLDHPILVKDDHTTTITDEKNQNQDEEEEPLILVSFKFFCHPHMTGVPTSLINFILRKGVGKLWYKLLRVAIEIKEGKRPEHTKMIESKPEIYEFIHERANVMLHRLHQEQEEEEKKKQQQQQHAISTNKQTSTSSNETATTTTSTVTSEG